MRIKSINKDLNEFHSSLSCLNSQIENMAVIMSEHNDLIANNPEITDKCRQIKSKR